MAFQQAMLNNRNDQQDRLGLQELTPGCMRYSNSRLLQQFHHNSSLQENLTNRTLLAHNPHSQICGGPRKQETLHQQALAQPERAPGGSARRRSKLSFSRWHMMISSRYKTELCRQFSEDGICPFEEKCLFAHGQEEIRPLPRHPKYKTELCRDFHQVGFCSFGPRCNFIHSITDVAALTVRLREDGRSSTPDSGNESCDDQSSSLSSASPILTPDQTQEETFFHFPEGLFREITEGTRDVLEPNLQDLNSHELL